jgi:predicted permease
MIGSLLQDLRYSLRGLLAKPLFLVIAVLTLGLGIGANTAIFSVLHGLLLRPLPYADGERLVEVYNRYPNMNLDYAGTSIPDFLDRSQAPSVEDMAIYTFASFGLGGDGGAAERLSALRASPSLFSTLGVQAAQGQVFTKAHAEPGNEQVAVLSHELWQNRFNADPGIVGRELRLNGQPFRVLGVMPAGFGFPNQRIQLWVPFAFTEQQKSDNERGNEYSLSIARLKAGTTLEGAIAEFDTIIARHADRLAGLGTEQGRRFAEFLRGGNFKAGGRSLREQQVGETRPMLLILQVAVGLVLLIACANVANLLLIRMQGRRKELTLRSALGASRGRIAAQVFAEALLLAFMGGLVGLLVALLTIELLPALGVQPESADYAFRLDATVLGFAAGVSLLAGLLATALPLFNLMRMDVGESLKEGGRSGSGGRAATLSRQALVVTQIALATTLLIGAGLLLRSYQALADESPGFSTAGVLSARVDLDAPRFTETEARQAFIDQALQALRELPGVEAAAFTSNLPFSGSNSSGSYNIQGLEVADGQASPHGMQRQVSADYFRVMQIPLVAGRYLESGDSSGSEPVVVIDEHLARVHFEGREAIGQFVRRGGDSVPWARVVGVVATVKHQQLASAVSKETLYWPITQVTPGFGSFVLRSQRPPAELVDAVRDALRRVDPEQPVYDIRSLDERIAISLEGQRAPMLLLGLFATVALLLAALGIYGVLAYAVSQRTGELGVRMAIGAGPREVLRMVMGQGARLTAFGLGVGLVGAGLFARAASSQLFGIGAADPLTYVGVCLFLLMVALAACYLPARRAAATDPMEALRYE